MTSFVMNYLQITCKHFFFFHGHPHSLNFLCFDFRVIQINFHTVNCQLIFHSLMTIVQSHNSLLRYPNCSLVNCHQAKEFFMALRKKSIEGFKSVISAIFQNSYGYGYDCIYPYSKSQFFWAKYFFSCFRIYFSLQG